MVIVAVRTTVNVAVGVTLAFRFVEVAREVRTEDPAADTARTEHEQGHQQATPATLSGVDANVVLRWCFHGATRRPMITECPFF
jgi:hypothetical protein